MKKFVAVFDGLCEAAADPVEGIVGRVLMDTGYRDHLKDSNTEEDQQRLANIEELGTAARQFDDRFEEGGRLEEFLEQTSLVADTDAWDTESDRATLMTLHAAKGLEFPVIYIVAVEQGILPHERSKEDPKQLEEERRLLFVGITRAKHNLQLSLTRSREYRGQIRRSVPSNFIMELPRHDMECFGTEPTMHRELAPSQHQRSHSSTDEALEEEQLDELALEWAEHERSTQRDVREGKTLGDYANPSTPTGRTPADSSALEGTPTGSESSPLLANESPSPSPRQDRTSPILTAAQLLGENDAEPDEEQVAPDAFALGMLVTHPEYGPGKIIALSGKGQKRVATIQFLQPPDKRKFHLAFSPLRPVGQRC